MTYSIQYRAVIATPIYGLKMHGRPCLFPVQLLFTLAILIGVLGLQPADKDIDRVAALLLPNKLGVTPKDLRSMPNPKGKGTFVFVPQTRFHGVERLIFWLVLDGKVYPLNGPTRGTVTPTLPPPYDVPETVWKKAGLPAQPTQEALEIVFGKR